jgi:hypothetical protein
MQPRVFVSSIMEGYSSFREAARRAIVDSNAVPVLVEDFPSLVVSPRTACLDAVASSDVVVTIVGLRGGWKTPSGKLVVEEEFDEAKRAGLRTLVFVQEGDRDVEAETLAKRLSDYVTGRFRLTFRTPDELHAAIRSTLPSAISNAGLHKADLGTMQEEFRRPWLARDETTVRVVVQPEREAEVIDPVKLGSAELKKAVFSAGHDGIRPLLSYERSKKASVGISELVVLQEDDDWRAGRQNVRVEVRTNGTIVIDSNVTGRRPNSGFNIAETHRVVDEDVAGQVTSSLEFAARLYGHLDPYERYDRFYVNASLGGMGYRTFGPPLMNTSLGIRMGEGSSEPVVAFDTPRIISREELVAVTSTVEGLITMFARRLVKDS